MLLTHVDTGLNCTVSSLNGDKRLLSRITSIGITEGCELTVLQNKRKRPILVYARNSMLALDREDCQSIEVEVLS